jgi:hypothetical protein
MIPFIFILRQKFTFTSFALITCPSNPLRHAVWHRAAVNQTACRWAA